MAISTNISHSPRVVKNLNNAGFVFLLPYKKAEVPARNTNTGAQK
jgi:hypothetical protein